MFFSISDPLLSLAIVLLAGLGGGALARRVKLPGVTGQILVGVLIGQSGLALFDHSLIEGLRPVTHFALGLIALTVGSHLYFPRLRNAGPRLLRLAVLEFILIPVLVFFAVILFDRSNWIMGMLLGAIAVATAPATSLAIVWETRSKGVLVKTLLAAVAVNNIGAIVLFGVAYRAARIALGHDAGAIGSDLWMGPLTELGFSSLVGIGCGLLFRWVTPLTVRINRLPIASLVMILLTWGLASALHVSPLLAALFLGITLVNLDPQNEHLTATPFEQFEPAILAAFFTLAGIELDLSVLRSVSLLAIAVFAARMAGKYVAAYWAMSFSKATDRLRKYLGFAMVPQAGVTVGLILLVQDDPGLISIRSLFLAVALSVVILNEILGPIFARLALEWAGEIGKDRPRVIDFLHEENIIIDLKANTKAEAIEQLTNVLVDTNRLRVDRKKLLTQFLIREADTSTCIGDGLALPHGRLDEGEEIVGAMGISQEGLHLDTPDGRLVHCMVLLATPPSQKDRYLEVLAAITRALFTNPTLRDQVYSARSPAHAYELLHVGDAEDFNYFLESN